MLRGVAQIVAAACVASVLAAAASGEQGVAKAAPTPTVVHGTAQIIHGGVLVELAELARSTAHGAVKNTPHVPFVPGERAAFGSIAAPAIAGQAEPLAPSPAATGFLALDDNNTSIPPDTHGAVGPNDVMTTLNTQVRVQDKAGAIRTTFTLDSFWATLNPVPLAFDPKVIYDPLAQRFVFTAMADAGSATSRVLMGVSETSDADSWLVFGIDADPSNLDWADFPSIGFDGSRVVVSVNMFDNATDSFQGARLFVFDKPELYDHDGTIAVTTLDDPDTFFGGFTLAPASTLDPGVNTTYLVEDWNGTSGAYRLSTITGAAPNEVLTVNVAFPQVPATWDFRGASGADFAPQLGSAQKIQTNDSRIGNCVYRGGSNWCAHTVFLPLGGPTRSAVQWFELSPAGVVRQFGRIDDATGGAFYAFPSLAVNATNDVLIGYSRFGAGQHASANYAYRTCGDVLGTMRDDTVLKPGEGPYWKTFSGTRNRWGDYSHTVVDPSDDATMWTIQEYAAPPVGFPAADSGRWGTWWGRVPAPTSGRPAPTNPSASSTSHSSSAWRSDTTVDVNWSGAASGCGIDGFSYSFTSGAADSPDRVKDAAGNVTSATSAALGNGPVYFHLRTLDRVGIWSDPIHAGPFLVDALVPVDPQLSSSSHTVGTRSTKRVVRIGWQGAADGDSGVDGFSFSWDRSATSVPDDIKDAEESSSGTASPPFGPGSHWFHLRTRDNAGNWTSTVHLGPFVITRPRCVVPNVKGKTLAQARRVLAAQRCALGRVTRGYSRKVRKGRVISQRPTLGRRLPPGTKVHVKVSRGRRPSR